MAKLKDEGWLKKLADLAEQALKCDALVRAENVPVVNELVADVAATIAVATAPVNGLCLIVRQPVYTANKSEAFGGLVTVLLEIVCREWATNGRAIHRDTLATRASGIFDNFKVEDLGLHLTIAKQPMVTEVQNDNGDVIGLDYIVRLEAVSTLPTLPRVAELTIGIVDGLVTIETPTEGAEVYYVISEEGNPVYPGPGVPESVLYTGPFAQPGVGARIFAAAFKQGMTGSWPKSGLVTDAPPPPPTVPDAPQGVSVTPGTASAQTTVQFTVSWSSVADEGVRFRVQAPGQPEWTSANNYDTYYSWSAYQDTVGTFEVTVTAFNNVGDSEPVTVSYTLVLE